RLSPDFELVVEYRVDSATANSTYGANGLTIEFFKADAEAFGEGKTFLGSDLYPESSAQTSKSVNLGDAAALGVNIADLIVATATDDEGNTSEFSLAVRAEQEVRVTVSSSPQSSSSQITYNITVTNSGLSNATGIKLTDTLPTNSAFESATATQGTCAEVSGVVECVLGDLAKDPGDPSAPVSARVTIVVGVPGPGTYENKVDVEVDQPNQGGAPSVTNSTTISPPIQPPGGGGGGGGSTTTTILPSAPLIVLEPPRFEVKAIKGEADPEPLIMTISNEGEIALDWTATSDAPWLTLAPLSGTVTGTPRDVNLQVNTTLLEPGTHVATITIVGRGAANSPQIAEVRLTLEPALPRIGVNQDNFTFTGVRGGELPPPKDLEIRNTGGRTLEWSASANVDWIILSLVNGSTDEGQLSPVSIFIDSVDLSDGAHEATIEITAEGAANSPRTVKVTLL
ncbi:MAG: hypothetical protein L0177_19355, partial [Chloroflexi bacterium]|nr:hypothetical protein [Chloroflexota bacterium]